MRGNRETPKQKQPMTKRRRLMRRAYIALLGVSAVIVAVFAAYKLLVVKPELPPVRPPQPVGEGEAPGKIHTGGRKEDFYTFLLIGRDTGGGGNTDTVMLVAYDVKNQDLSVMSIPRDTMVNVSWDIKRINSVYNQYGGGEKGIQALFSEVSQLVGFTPDFSVVVEWEAVGKMAEAIGGVDFEVPIQMDYDDPTQDLHIHIDKGMQHLDGEGVMKVLRFRDGNPANGKRNTGYITGDIGRIETQQALLKAIVEKLLKVRDPGAVLDLARVFGENVTTELTIPNIFWFAQQAVLGKPALSMESVNFITMPCSSRPVWSRSFAGRSYEMQSYVVVNTDELVAVVNQHFNPYLEELDQTELDIMYVNSDGTIGSSTGVLEDARHNPAWQAYQNPAPAASEPPEAPAETSPEESEPPMESVPSEPEPTEESRPPAETGAPPEAAPTEEPAPAPTSAPTPEPDPNAPPEGIPIL